MNCKNYNIKLCPACNYNNDIKTLFAPVAGMICFINSYINDINIYGAKETIRKLITSEFNMKFLPQIKIAFQMAAPEHVELLEKLLVLL